jgi:hypothetical protein
MAISDKVESPPMIVDGEELLLDATRPVHEPATGEVMAYAPEADASHAEQAVAAARAAFRRGDWSRIAPPARARPARCGSTSTSCPGRPGRVGTTRSQSRAERE